MREEANPKQKLKAHLLDFWVKVLLPYNSFSGIYVGLRRRRRKKNTVDKNDRISGTIDSDFAEH
jgi:hypothetical protein